MKRFRFHVPGDDPRPMGFPPEAPFWCTGYTETGCIVVAYSPDLETLTSGDRWPDAENVEDWGKQPIRFSSRFPCPDWWDPTHEAHSRAASTQDPRGCDSGRKIEPRFSEDTRND